MGHMGADGKGFGGGYGNIFALQSHGDLIGPGILRQG